MNMKDIAQKKDAELETFLTEKREEIRTFRFGTVNRDVRAVRENKKTVARVLTEMNKRRAA